MKAKRLLRSLCLGWFAACLMVSCSVNRFVPEGSYLLDRVTLATDSSKLNTDNLNGYIRQHPNSRWFSAIPVPLGVYSLSGTDSTKRINKFLRRLGEAPVLYREDLALKTKANIQSAVQNMGYLNAGVDLEKTVIGKRVRIRYRIHPGNLYMVRNAEIEIRDSSCQRVMDEGAYHHALYGGMPFDLNVLDAERDRLNTFLTNRGYYRFTKDFIRFEADSTLGNHQVDLKMILERYRSGTDQTYRPHTQYRIGDVSYIVDSTRTGKPFLRSRVAQMSTEFRPGELYSEEAVRGTYSRLNRLGAVMSTNVRFRQQEQDTTKLDAEVVLTRGKRNSFHAELEGTNSAGDFGAAFSTTFQNRNVFRGSEMFSVKLRGAFEAIKGLSGYQDQNYIEYGAETTLSFPSLRFPWLPEYFHRRTLATSELSLMYDSQNRPEFHRRVLTAAWRYKWSNGNRKTLHRVDLLDLNYVFMPWISSTFRELYLDDPENRNAILRYNYENLFIMKWGYSFTYSSRPNMGASLNYGTDAYIIRAGVETSGNFLYGLSNALGTSPNAQNQYTLFSIAYAQYAKFDFDFTKSFYLSDRNSLAFHFGLGVAYPYGNSTILPYEKRYFSGGANSVRGWSVRELGPGTFRGNDGRIDFINQTGDMKLDINLEYRARLFWKLDGAAFVDAGNIWTMRAYDEQPGGQFRIDSFWRQIAVSYGLGIRLNFDYFILRLDGGMKAVHPSYTDSRRHFPIIHPNFGRDFTLHFAVGLPF